MVFRTSPQALFIKEPEQRDWDPFRRQLGGGPGVTGLIHHATEAGTTRHSANFSYTMEQHVLGFCEFLLLAGCPDFNLILPVRHDVLREEE